MSKPFPPVSHRGAPPPPPPPHPRLRFSGEEIKFLIRHPNARLAKRSLLPIKRKDRKKKKKKSVLSIYKIGPLGFHPPTQLKVLMMRSVTAPAASQPPPELTFSVEASRPLQFTCVQKILISLEAFLFSSANIKTCRCAFLLADPRRPIDEARLQPSKKRRV